jgi:hypothetical protein
MSNPDHFISTTVVHRPTSDKIAANFLERKNFQLALSQSCNAASERNFLKGKGVQLDDVIEAMSCDAM